jgi:DNA-binding NtrC family response regulator
VPLLAAHFVERFGRESDQGAKAIDPEAMRLLQDCAWPGNVRELRSALERAVILADGETVGFEHLPPEMSGASPEADAARVPSGAVERGRARLHPFRLAQNGGNRSRAALSLGISEGRRSATGSRGTAAPPSVERSPLGA